MSLRKEFRILARTVFETEPRRIAPGVFMVGGPDLTDPRDCLCYLVVGSQATILVDCGAGPSARDILDLAQRAGGGMPSHLLLTHAHIDHVGGAAEIRRLTGCAIFIHQGDADTLSSGDPVRSAAQWCGLKLEAVSPDMTFSGPGQMPLGTDRFLNIIPTPGHTPGSVAAWCRAGDQKVLFAQDIHGPFSAAFGSDVEQWRESMTTLLELEADILAEGHYGVFRPASEVATFIQGQMDYHQED